MHSTDEFVYVNQDGSVRELSRSERAYLSEDFHPGDSGRPYIKTSYKSKDGWGSISGFLLRTLVPRHVMVEPVNPSYMQSDIDARQQMIEDSKRIGDIVTENADGSVTCAPNPNVPRKTRFELMRQIQLERQRERERLARHKQSQQAIGDNPSPRAVAMARIWLLVLGCAWSLAGFVVGGSAGGSRGWGLVLVAVGLLHFAVARYVKRRMAVFLSGSR